MDDNLDTLYLHHCGGDMICRCGSTVEVERAELGLKTCLRCAKLISPKKVRGRMVYAHKTGATIEVLSAESYEENKKYFVPQGTFSSVKNFSKPTG